MSHQEAEGSKWGNPPTVYRQYAQDMKNSGIWSLGQWPVQADRIRGEFKAVRQALLTHQAHPGGDSAPENPDDAENQWEQGYVAAFMPAIQAKLIQTGEITQEEIDEIIGINYYEGLRQDIEAAVAAAQPINHITG